MKLGIIAGNKRGYDEIDIEIHDIDYISSTKKNRLLGANRKVFRLTGKGYTALYKVLKQSKVVNDDR